MSNFAKLRERKKRAEIEAEARALEQHKKEDKRVKSREYYQENREKILKQKKMKKIAQNREDLRATDMPLFLDEYVSIGIRRDKESGAVVGNTYTLKFNDEAELANFLNVCKFKSAFTAEEMITIVKQGKRERRGEIK